MCSPFYNIFWYQEEVYRPVAMVLGWGLTPLYLYLWKEGRSHRGKVGNYYNSCNIARNQMMSIKHLVMMELYGAFQTEVRPSAWILPSTTYFGVRKRFYRPVTMALGWGLDAPLPVFVEERLHRGKVGIYFNSLIIASIHQN